MISVRVHHYRDPTAVVLALDELGGRGLSPRSVLFIALDPRGETHIAVADDAGAVARLRVGDKLTLVPPWQGRYFHFDAIQRLPGGGVVWNGDRRLAEAGCPGAVACAVALWLMRQSDRDPERHSRSLVLGCTPHQTGSWWTASERGPTVDLHASGFDHAVAVATGLIARRAGEPTLYYAPLDAVKRGDLRGSWVPVYRSGLGNVLMLERRVVAGGLVLSCERGLVEIDVTGLPDRVGELAAVEVDAGLGVVGRTGGDTFAVTRGRVEPWGLVDLAPAVLVAAEKGLADLPAALQ